MEIFGLPAHVLLVHGAVVLTPLAVLLALTFALHPPSRYLTRWPTLVLSVAATGAVWAAKLTGGDLQESRGIPGSLIHTHQERGNQLALMMLGFLVVAVAAALLLGGASGLVTGRGARADAAPAVELGLRVVLVLAALLVLVWVVLTGDAGARATWG